MATKKFSVVREAPSATVKELKGELLIKLYRLQALARVIADRNQNDPLCDLAVGLTDELVDLEDRIAAAPRGGAA